MAALTTSLVMTAGAAFASPTSGVAGGAYLTGLLPGPVSGAVEDGRNTVAEADRQVHELRTPTALMPGPVSGAIEDGRNTVAEADRQIQELRKGL